MSAYKLNWHAKWITIRNNSDAIPCQSIERVEFFYNIGFRYIPNTSIKTEPGV